MRKTLIALGALILTPGVAFAAGALAIDSNQGDSWGWSAGYSSQNEADSRALRECGSDCHIVQRFNGGCAAYAADQASGSTVYGWSVNYPDSASAQNEAMRQCRAYGGTDCLVRVWACDGNSPGGG